MTLDLIEKAISVARKTKGTPRKKTLQK